MFGVACWLENERIVTGDTVPLVATPDGYHFPEKPRTLYPGPGWYKCGDKSVSGAPQLDDHSAFFVWVAETENEVLTFRSGFIVGLRSQRWLQHQEQLKERIN